MRKIFLLFAMLTALHAAALKQVPPFDPYFTDISFDAKTNKLKFTDTYKATEAVDRNYTIEFYFRTTDTAEIFMKSHENNVNPYLGFEGSTTGALTTNNRLSPFIKSSGTVCY